MIITKKEAQELVEYLKQALVKAEELSKEHSGNAAMKYAYMSGYLEGVIKTAVRKLGGSIF